MMKQEVICIIDVGKTNKKLLLFDRNYQVVCQQTENLPETEDEDGFPCEDVELLTRSVRELIDKAVKDDRFVICALNFTSYGASFVYINENGEPVAPLYNYLKPFPEKLQNWFYQTYGDEAEIARTTASPVLGSLNSGLQILRLKHERPEVWSQVSYALHLPQYLAFLFHQKVWSDITSIGCHTQLWNFDEHRYHNWVVVEGLDKKFGPIIPCDHAKWIDLGGRIIPCGVGLHDSSAALIPYLRSFRKPFVLVSTGTWSISLNPFNHTPLTAEELAQDCLCYLQYNGQPVKASRLFMGRIHDAVLEKISEQFQISADELSRFYYNEEEAEIAQMKVTDIRSIEDIDFSAVSSPVLAYHLLMAWLVREQIRQLQLVLNGSDAEVIYVDGGFSRNRIFMRMLSTSFKGKQVFASQVAQATALGAALALHDHWNAGMPVDHLIQLIPY